MAAQLFLHRHFLEFCYHCFDTKRLIPAAALIEPALFCVIVDQTACKDDVAFLAGEVFQL